MINAKIIASSISEFNDKITTMQLEFPRFILPEFNTHRKFSRSASSSRAIPVLKMIQQLQDNPAMPTHWGKNQPGMQALEELTGEDRVEAVALWYEARNYATQVAKEMVELGLHKQVINRILEPFQYIHVVVTSTEWDNFFGLRCHPDAQPEFQVLATKMKEAIEASTPTLKLEGEWHLPYITGAERKKYGLKHLLQASAARCCRVSYLKHDGENPDISDDIKLCNKLLASKPFHASPFEHVATPSKDKSLWGNFDGWAQYRKLLERDLK